MRRARITFPGAFHHAMNRGYDGMHIFEFKEDKEIFLKLLKKNIEKSKVSVHAYCIMNSHYHLIIQNLSGRMSEFFKRLNGEYGSIYRKKHGGRGYVFQDRFKSILIQKDVYLMNAIAYVLNNPVDAGIVSEYSDYPWSSANQYFNRQALQMIDGSFVAEAFSSNDSFRSYINMRRGGALKAFFTKMGSVYGDKKFIQEAKVKFERRAEDHSLERKRINDKFFEPLQKVFYEFERKHNIEPDRINTTTYDGKRLRAELLVNLKDQSGLTYKEISCLDLFSDVKFSSLGNMYKNTKVKLKKSEYKNTSTVPHVNGGAL